MSLWSRIANALRADRLSREIDEELQSHIAEAVERGRDPVEARRAFGSALMRPTKAAMSGSSRGWIRCARIQYSAGGSS
jgi:hypothetical protein